MRRTRQLSLIQEILRNQERPISIGRLHSLAVEQIPGIAYSTVFRRVQTMLEAGDITPVEIEFRPTRYESRENRSRHHFFCRRCEEAYRLDDAPFASMDHKLPTCKVEDYHLILYGICEACLHLAPSPGSLQHTGMMDGRFGHGPSMQPA